MAVKNKNNTDKTASQPKIRVKATGAKQSVSDRSTRTQAGKTARQATQNIQQKPTIPGTESALAAKRSKVARNQFVIFTSFILTFLLFTILLGNIVLYLSEKTFESAGALPEAQIVLIRPGAGIGEIATKLEKEGLIRSSDIFIYNVNNEKKSKALKAGEYEIPAHASMRQIMDILVTGRSIEHPFTVPEGLTVAQVFERLKNNELLEGDLPNVLPDEGSLMADTIKFVRGTPKVEILKRLREGQSRLVREIWAGRDPNIPLKNINELITLASIVEKETGIPSERPQVAAVFYNRLKKNMRLQSDPTVIYGVYGGAGKPADSSVPWSDLLKAENRFNTYRNNGLPPSPIAIPGRASLKAVANPLHTDDLYFVADGTGGHIFAKTLSEHNSNVQKWRRLKRIQDSVDGLKDVQESTGNLGE